MPKIMVGLAVLALVFGLGCGGGGNTEAERAGIEAAEGWLALIDRGDYGRSWDDSAAYFRAAVDKGTWERQMASFRVPLGGLVSRKVRSAKYMTDLPGAPDGEYVVIEFETSFEHKQEAVELVTPMKDGDGRWRVSGYYIK